MAWGSLTLTRAIVSDSGKHRGTEGGRQYVTHAACVFLCLSKGRTNNAAAFDVGGKEAVVVVVAQVLTEKGPPSSSPLPEFQDRSQQGPGAPSVQVIGCAPCRAWCIRGERACPKPSLAAAAALTASPTATATCPLCPRGPRRHRRERTWAAHPCQVRSALAAGRTTAPWRFGRDAQAAAAQVVVPKVEGLQGGPRSGVEQQSQEKCRRLRK